MICFPLCLAPFQQLLSWQAPAAILTHAPRTRAPPAAHTRPRARPRRARARRGPTRAARAPLEQPLGGRKTASAFQAPVWETRPATSGSFRGHLAPCLSLSLSLSLSRSLSRSLLFSQPAGTARAVHTEALCALFRAAGLATGAGAPATGPRSLPCAVGHRVKLRVRACGGGGRRLPAMPGGAGHRVHPYDGGLHAGWCWTGRTASSSTLERRESEREREREREM